MHITQAVQASLSLLVIQKLLLLRPVLAVDGP